MRILRSARWLAALGVLAIGATGCFGYNRSAKRWAYVGDTVLMLGGGGAIAADVLLGGDDGGGAMAAACEGRGCPYDPPVSGAIVAGTVLVTAGLVGLLVNATRPTVKTSR